MSGLPNSRKLALVALFTALAIILNFLISVPDPGATFLFFEVWEVPIYAILLILGVRSAATVAVLNALVLEVVKPGSLPTGPLYNLIAILATFSGILLAKRASGSGELGRRVLWVPAAVAGACIRTLVMTLVNWIVLPVPPPIGFGLERTAVTAYLVPIGVFNFIVAIYSVPVAFSVYWAVAKRYRLLPTSPTPGRAA